MVSARLLLLLAAAACAAALPAAQPAFALRASASKAPALAAQSRSSPSEKAAVERLRGGGPPIDVLIKAAIGGAFGASIRAYLQNMVPAIGKYGPWKHIVAVNAFGATLVGIATSGRLSKELALYIIPCVRIISAIITIDSYNLYDSGKKNEAALYLATVVPMNLLFNYIGRHMVAPVVIKKVA